MNIVRILSLMTAFLPSLVVAEDTPICTTPSECFLLVQQTVESNTRYDSSSAGDPSSAVVNFKLDESFSISKARIVSSSGIKELDAAVLDAVQQIGSLPQLRGLRKSDTKKFTSISLKISK